MSLAKAFNSAGSSAPSLLVSYFLKTRSVVGKCLVTNGRPGWAGSRKPTAGGTASDGSFSESWNKSLRQFSRRLLEGSLCGGLLGNVHRHAGLAINSENLTSAPLRFDFDAGF